MLNIGSISIEPMYIIMECATVRLYDKVDQTMLTYLMSRSLHYGYYTFALLTSRRYIQK